MSRLNSILKRRRSVREGDYYAPTNGSQVSANRAAAIETCTAQANAKFGDSGDINWRRFNHDAYAECMLNKGQDE
jgi:hypothetical protein